MSFGRSLAVGIYPLAIGLTWCTSFDGRVFSKADIIPEGGGPGGFAGAAPEETSVRIFGGTAVVMGSIRTAGAHPGEFHVTLVCQKKPQGWQMIAARPAHTAAQEK